ncbi:MAG: hypothetical protein KAU62_05945 [Candidatus Heimdallarchaeota archaeon]|nr:hypothetical protein [Candidatus Heimdallarchaeota archaeon]MCG3255608.1 hypothetical protein [Candidatus Heimdallarchaeota archaeon]MCK4610683.1 hypothetical protein [Candidatus Heimdallarchaeota archaeon]
MNLEKIAHYQIWANDKIREIIVSLKEEEFAKENIQDLCAHTILAIEYNLETKVHKKSVDVEVMYEELYNLSKEELLNKWKETDERLLEHIKNITEEKIEFPNFVKGEGKVYMTQEDYYFQYLSHTIYHRAQLMTALKKLGKEGKTTDYLMYLFDVEFA